MKVSEILGKVKHCWARLKYHSQTFNLFPSRPPTTDAHQLRNEVISTRLFLVLLVISLVVLLLYNSIIPVIKTATVHAPTYADYARIHAQHSQTLTCPCAKISIGYREILDVRYTFHQVCSSDFVDQRWIRYLDPLYSPFAGDMHARDFRAVATYAFQALYGFCELVDGTLSHSLSEFYSSQYVSTMVTPIDFFRSQIDEFIGQFRASTTNTFLTSLSLVRQTTQSNALKSAIGHGHALTLIPPSDVVHAGLKPYPDCTCATKARCTIPADVMSYPGLTILFSVPKFYSGCYVIEALLQSSLECFHNQTCIDEIVSFMIVSPTFAVRALHQSSASKYFINSTILELLEKLMIEDWHGSGLHDKYYEACRPAQCTYTYKGRNGLVNTVTTLIGLLGGLVTVLKVAVPISVKFVRRKKRRQTSEPGAPFRQQFYSSLKKSKQYIEHLNLFSTKTPVIDEHKIRNEVISTRLFVVLLVISLVVLLLYNSIIPVTKAATVHAPTYAAYTRTHAKHAQTLTCPCAKISIDYGEILDVRYTFHQVCTSDFVGDKWINYLAHAIATVHQNILVRTFPVLGTYAFQALRGFCELANETLTNRRKEFFSRQYVSVSVTPSNVFQSQFDAFLEQFRLSTMRNFWTSLAIVRKATQGNALFSLLQTNYFYTMPSRLSTGVVNLVQYSSCSCVVSATCVNQSSIHKPSDPSKVFLIPGFYVGCYVVEALLQSSLECFYNQTCINRIRSFMSTTSGLTFTPLNALLPSNFTFTSAIGELLEKLMVEEWHASVLHKKYYETCRPAQCTYTYKTRNDVLFIVTTLIGLLGGLVTVLKVTVPVVVRFIRRRKRHDTDDAAMRRRKLLLVSCQKLMHHIKHFNLFSSKTLVIDEQKLRNEVISTRLFVVLLVLSLVVLLLYNSIIPVTKTATVHAPTYAAYTWTHTKHAQTLTCPCARISIDYGEILDVRYTFHQVCTSDFVDDRWIRYLLDNVQPNTFNYPDFRVSCVYAFQALRGFCDLVNETLADSLTEFRSRQYVSASVTPSDLFRSQTEELIEQFRASSTNFFLTSLLLIRQTTQGNALQSGLLSNVRLRPTPTGMGITSVSLKLTNCTCISSTICTQPSTVHDYSNSTRLFFIPGFYSGCYVIESLLYSSLECFYDQACVNEILSYMYFPPTSNITALETASLGQYSVNATVMELLGRLMIEEWNASVLHEKYYEACRPALCIYTYESRNDLVFIVTTLIGLLGGLVTVLKIVAPLVVKMFAYCFRRRRVKIEPEIRVSKT